MKNKKTIMLVSALMILVYHLWVSPFSRGTQAYEIEQFIRFICFVGVDMFFFVSAYSIARSNTEDYGRFVWARFKAIYLEFAVFALIALACGQLNAMGLLKALTGWQLFEKGGGSFLWFAPAIMLVYLLLPLYKKLEEQYPPASVLMLFVWLAVGLLITKRTGYNSIFIFYNRIPVILLGYIFGKYDIPERFANRRPLYITVAVLSAASGVYLLWNIGYRPVLNKPVYDMFYVLGLPLTIGLVMLLDLIPAGRFIRAVGSVTFEMYAIQMIFGFKAADTIYRLTGSPVFTNLLVVTAVTAVSYCVGFVFKAARRRLP